MQSSTLFNISLPASWKLMRFFSLYLDPMLANIIPLLIILKSPVKIWLKSLKGDSLQLLGSI